MPKINTYELLKILVWFLSLSNIFREHTDIFLDPFGAIFIWVISRNDSEGFTYPHFKFKWNLNMMHTWLASLGHTKTGDVTTRPHLKESRPEIQGSTEESGVLKSKTSSRSQVASLSEWWDHWTLRNLMLWRRVTCCAWSRMRIGVLSICEVILEIKHFVVHSADRIWEATPELGDVEDIMHSGKMWG